MFLSEKCKILIIWEELCTRLTLCSRSLCIMFVISVISRFGFEGWILGSDCSHSWSLFTCYFQNHSSIDYVVNDKVVRFGN